jgi:hypothetical protein
MDGKVAGICCRVKAAMDDFLATGQDWFLRAMDDSWFNVPNLVLLTEQLGTFMNPQRHIVIKGHLSPFHVEKWGFVHLQGGAPILMSRAAVEFVCRYFTAACDVAPWQSDDVALTILVHKMFPSAEFWADVRFGGPPATAHSPGPFAAEWKENAPSHFQHFQRQCDTAGKLYWKPWKTFVGGHTIEFGEWREGVEFAHLDWISENLTLEWRPEIGYGLCFAPMKIVRELVSLNSLRVNTPLIQLGDPSLTFSRRDVAAKSLELCPYVRDANCDDVRSRIAAFRDTL